LGPREGVRWGMARRPDVRLVAAFLGLAAIGCGRDSTPPMRDTGPRDAPPFDGAADDTGGTSDFDAAGTDVGPGSDGGGASSDAPDAPRISMPCTATGTCDPFIAGICPVGEGCLVGASGTACTMLTSTVAAVGAACTASNGCEPGSTCLDYGDGLRCHRMCPEGSIGFCGTGATCSGTFGDACVRVCRPLPTRCDIYAQDCADAALACVLVENLETGERYTGCRAPGTLAEGALCGGGMGACAEGLVCVTLSSVSACRRVCREDGTAPTCTAPETCTGRTGGWGVTFCRTPPTP
jgi:hypothetical protein